MRTPSAPNATQKIAARKPGWADLETNQKMYTVAELFCGGLTADEVLKRLQREFRGTITRVEPYRLLREAALRGWLRLEPSREDRFSRDLEAHYPFLRSSGAAGECPRVSATWSPLADGVGVGEATADVILRLLIQKAAEKTEATNHSRQDVAIHLGFAGGKTMAVTAAKLKKRLEQPNPLLPGKIVFHSLMPGFAVAKPYLSPTAFLANFSPSGAEPLHYKCEFVDFEAPPFVPIAKRQSPKSGKLLSTELDHESQAPTFEQLKNLPTIKDAFQERDKIDIIVTSAGEWGDPHSLLKGVVEFFARDPSVMPRLAAKYTFVGDLLWLPLLKLKGAATGEFCEADPGDMPWRPMCLFDLAELSRKIKENAYVVLAVGNCQACGGSKETVLLEILEASQKHSEGRLLTHLVCNLENLIKVIRKKEELRP